MDNQSTKTEPIEPTPSEIESTKPAEQMPSSAQPTDSNSNLDNILVDVEVQWGDSILPLSLPIDATILRLKTQLHEFTGITLSKIRLSGLGITLTNDTLLAALDLSKPLKLEEKETSVRQASILGSRIVDDEEDEDENEGGFQVNSQTQEQLLTMLDALPPINFKEDFEKTYGKTHPVIFQGSCKDAVSQSKKRSVPLIVYLHYPEHENTAPFCYEALSSPAFSTVVDDNFIFWVGSMDSNLEGIVKTFLGTSKFPLMVVTAHLTSSVSVLDIIQGTAASSEIVARLLGVLESHGPELAKLKIERAAREGNRSILEEQDEAYQRSLEIDAEKARIREIEDAKRMEVEAKEKEAKDALIKEKEGVMAKRLSELPSEPAANEESTTVMIRMGDGSKMSRKFRLDETIGHLRIFIDSKKPLDAEHKDYDLSSNFPRQTFNDESVTFRQGGLFPQASLFVSDK